MNLSQNQLKAIKKALPKAGMMRIAQKTGLDYRSVQYVFDGKWQNDDVIEAAKDIIRSENELVKQLLRDLLKAVA